MTLPAVDSWNVRGVEGPAYKVGPNCANPNCRKFAEHAHHIIRRSQLVRDYDWVAIEGFVIGNRTGLCPSCHDDITGMVGGHKAAIRWVGDEFVWCLYKPERDDPYMSIGALTPQPPTPDKLATSEPRASDLGPDSCPFCGQHNRRRSTTQRVGRRRRKSWTVLVPDEEVEDGADVLDSLVANLAPLVPNADNSASGRYFVLVQALAYAMISAEDFVASFKGKQAA